MAEYQNPGQEPGGDKRMLIVFVVLLLAISVAQPFLKKFLPQPPTPPAQTQPVQAPAQAKPSSSPAASAAQSAAPTNVEAKQASSETETVIENDLYRITFTNRGAQVKSWILKKFDNDAQKGPLDMVNPAAAQKYGYPLSLWTYDEGLRNRLNSALYVPSVIRNTDGLNELSPAKVTVTSSTGEFYGQVLKAPASISFEYADGDLVVRKTFSFDHTYVVKIESSVTQNGSPVPALPAWPAGFGDQATPAFYATGLIDYQFNSKIERVAYNKVSGGATLPGPFHWAGPNDQYFAAIFIPDDPNSVSMVTLRQSIENPQDAKRPFEVVGGAVGNLHGPTSERFYVGPKELEVLQKVSIPGITGADNDLNGLVDYGWWGIIAKPLFLWLKWTYYHVVHSWGWAIIVQTILISVALLPLRITSMRSMLKMQRIAPQVKSIQEKYKKYSLRDPRKAAMNEEISALYKQEGVNPAGGCLPMLIQFPFLIAYYRMLGTALDLRHAHFLWISDLSAAEPLPYILPILMVVSSLINQKMTPQAGMDPTQQRMMNVMMPLMMGFIFFRLAAGLNLYYAVSNLIMIGQQAIMNRTKVGREMRAIMEKRARKKDK